jgi:hypothetical protein
VGLGVFVFGPAWSRFGEAMLERIIAGLLIGVVAGFIESGLLPLSKKTQWITEGVMVLAGIGFVASSFTFGPVFGIAAIVEIAIGYSSASKVFRSRGRWSGRGQPADE